MSAASRTQTPTGKTMNLHGPIASYSITINTYPPYSQLQHNQQPSSSSRNSKANENPRSSRKLLRPCRFYISIINKNMTVRMKTTVRKSLITRIQRGFFRGDVNCKLIGRKWVERMTIAEDSRIGWLVDSHEPDEFYLPILKYCFQWSPRSPIKQFRATWCRILLRTSVSYTFTKGLVTCNGSKLQVSIVLSTYEHLVRFYRLDT